MPPWTTRIVSAVDAAVGEADAVAAAFTDVVATRGLVTGALAVDFDAGAAAAAGFGVAGLVVPAAPFAAGLLADPFAGEVFAARGGRGLAGGSVVESAMVRSLG